MSQRSKKVLVTTATCFALAVPLAVSGCSDKDDVADADAGADADSSDGAGGDPGEATKRYVLGSVSIDADGNRVSYAQIITELDGHFTNRDGIEAGGNAVFMAHGSDFFYGLAESPEWVRYSTKNGFEETGRLSFLNFGITYMDFNNVIVDDDTAVSILTETYEAVIWSPKDMEIIDTVDLSHLKKAGFSLEAWTPVTRGGLVYIPGRWVNWDALTVEQTVSLTILDPKKKEVIGVAEDERCGAGGRVTFDAKGYGYVMGDGRNRSMQTFANAADEPTVPNCLLRIAPGTTDFEQDFFFEIPGLTGGLDSMTELDTAQIDSGIGFSMMKYEDRIPDSANRLDFEHWDVPAYKLWRIVLGDEPRAAEVEGAHFSVIGFGGSGVAGKYYISESANGSESTVFEIDPDKNSAVEKFTMAGYFNGIFPIE